METQTVLTQVKRCLDNIDRFDQQVNAFIAVLSETALEEAQQADDNYAGGGGAGNTNTPNTAGGQGGSGIVVIRYKFQ